MKRFHITGRHTVIALALGGCATDPPEKLAATDQDTDLSTSLFRSAAESRAQGDLTAAATLYRQSHSTNPERADALIGLGQVLLAAGTPKPAADAFRKSLIIDTGNVITSAQKNST